jgi:subtilisin family serine protease
LSSGSFLRPGRRQGRRCAAPLAALGFFLALAAGVSGADAAVSPALDARIAATAPGHEIAVIATFADQVPDARYTSRPAALVQALQRRAQMSRADVTGVVDGPVQSFWLVNAVAFSGTPEEIRQVAADPEVADVDLDTVVHIADGGATTADRPFKDAGTGDWGLAASNVPAVWSTYGLYGAGVTVGTIDTGVTAENPDLVGKIAAWHDFVGNSPTPRDDNGHGTHTAGTIVGGSAGGAAIGVAPQARLVVAKAMNKNGSGSASALIAAAEWMTDPDGNPATADQPSVINNSWAAPGANDTWFRPMVKRWLELGIVPVFAAGNSGPDAGSVGNPASYPESLAVGAIDAGNVVAPFSGRGPVVWDDEDGTGPAAGATFIKPDISAPGVGITSSLGTGYLSYSGTSMAAPHVAGVAALLHQANTALTAQQIVDTLKATADDLGPAGMDSSYGTGRLDALKAVQTVVGAIPDTTFSRTPPAATRAQTLSYDMVLSGGATLVRTRVDGGAWSAPGTALTLSLSLPQGRHTVEAQAIGQTGLEDPTPASHVVTVDRTKPTLSFSMTRRGETAFFAARVTDRLSGVGKGTIRWSFGDGELARGAKVSRRFAEARTRRVVLTARDAAGNESFAMRRFVPRAAGAVRALTVARPGRGAGSLKVSGRLVRTASLTMTLRPLPIGGAATAGDLASSFSRPPLGALVAKAALGARGKGGFRLVLPIGGLKPGLYALDVRASERGTSLGSLRLTRRIEIS